MTHGFVRIGAATPKIKIADCGYNRERILAIMREAGERGCEILVLPELCLTGSTCGDLFFLPKLISRARESLEWIARESAGINMLTFIGLPYIYEGKLYNCAAAVGNGKVVSITPKTLLNTAERRYFSAYGERWTRAADIDGRGVSGIAAGSAFGLGLITFSQTRGENGGAAGGAECSVGSAASFRIGVEIGDEAYAPVSPAAKLALSGAVIIVNPSAECETAGKEEKRRDFIRQKSSQLFCGYVRAGAGDGESTTDLVFAGHNLISEHGKILAESGLFENGLVVTDVDTEYLAAERIKPGSFNAQFNGYGGMYSSAEVVAFYSSGENKTAPASLLRKFTQTPFVPAGALKRGGEVLAMQSAGLEQRLRHLKMENLVLALSGGLDSTLALIVAVRAFDRLGLPRKGICTVSMPCFGTSERTRGNAKKLANAFGVTFMEIPITDSVIQHFKDIGHDIGRHDLVYENAQARERTQVAMDLAAKRGGFVIGTGDMSELALGFATYNGDHMSMYGVNASVPKTLMPHIILAAAENLPAETQAVLRDVIDTPISPELLPPDAVTGGKQETENIVGPYVLHDFFLYYMLRRGASGAKTLFIAENAFEGMYSRDEIKKWLEMFTRRFFANQFKRSCMPDGVGVGTVSLSPRVGWLMASDVSVISEEDC